jgi:HAD superfamily hydrolase (TIGR01549 family)
MTAPVNAVLFDVDYTLIKPGPVFDVEGYVRNGRRFGLALDPERWPQAQRAAWAAVKQRRESSGHEHDMALIPAVTRAVVCALADDEARASAAEACEACAQYEAEQWWNLDNFTLFDDVLPCLERLHGAALRVGLVSNTNRDLDVTVAHFGLGPFVDVAVTSAQIGIMKPEPEIFLAALERLGIGADEAAMVGDNDYDDIRGALACGFAIAVLLDRRGRRHRLAERGEPTHEPAIDSLAELPALLGL